MTNLQPRIDRQYISADDLCPFSIRVHSGHVENPWRVQLLNVHLDRCLDYTVQRDVVQDVPVGTIVSSYLIAVPTCEHSGDYDGRLVPSSLSLGCAWNTLNLLSLVSTMLWLLVASSVILLDVFFFSSTGQSLKSFS